jgi:hypothetical protein
MAKCILLLLTDLAMAHAHDRRLGWLGFVLLRLRSKWNAWSALGASTLGSRSEASCRDISEMRCLLGVGVKWLGLTNKPFTCRLTLKLEFLDHSLTVSCKVSRYSEYWYSRKQRWFTLGAGPDSVLCVLCVLCVVGLFSAIGGPR